MALAFDPLTLQALDRSREIDMKTPRRDGSLSSRPIWVVVVDDTAYVRSYLGERGAWYRRARSDGRAAIGVNGRTLEVAVEPAEDEDLNRRVSAAFEAKYGRRSPQSTKTMVTPEATATTLRLAAA